jgi:hypothetical protein
VTVNVTPSITAQSAAICSGSAFSFSPSNGAGNIVPNGTTYTWSAPTVSGITGTASGSSASPITNTLVNTTNASINVNYTVTPSTVSPPTIGTSYNGGVIAYIFQPSDFGYTPGKVLIMYPSYLVSGGICGNPFTMSSPTAVT